MRGGCIDPVFQALYGEGKRRGLVPYTQDDAAAEVIDVRPEDGSGCLGCRTEAVELCGKAEGLGSCSRSNPVDSGLEVHDGLAVIVHLHPASLFKAKEILKVILMLNHTGRHGQRFLRLACGVAGEHGDSGGDRDVVGFDPPLKQCHVGIQVIAKLWWSVEKRDNMVSPIMPM